MRRIIIEGVPTVAKSIRPIESRDKPLEGADKPPG